jgi:hypothetical protein
MFQRFFSAILITSMVVGIAFFAYPVRIHAQGVPNCSLYPQTQDVAFNAFITVTCTESMNVGSVMQNLTLQPLQGQNIALGAPTILSDRTFVFNAPIFSADTTYAVVLGAGATSIADIPIASAVNQNFKTADNLFAVFMDSHDPNNLQANVDTTLSFGPIPGIRITYPAPMDDVTVSLFPSTPGTTVVDPAPNLLNTQWYFQPTGGSLLPNTDYIVTVSGNQQGGVASLDEYFVFRTGSAIVPDDIDDTAPTVISTDPVNLADDVAPQNSIEIVFSEDVDSQTLSVNLQDVTDNIAVSHENHLVGDTLNITVPALFDGQWLAYEHQYAVTVMAQDLAGNFMEAPYLLNFTTGTAPIDEPEDNTPPALVSTNPFDDGKNISVNTVVTFQFDENLDPNPNNATVTFLNSSGINPQPVVHQLTVNEDTITLTPDAPLDNDTLYYVSVDSVQDSNGNVIPDKLSISFTTEVGVPAGPDEIAPTVLSTLPANLATDVVAYPAITVTTSEPVKNSLTVSFKKMANNPIDVDFEVTHPTPTTFVITPVNFLAPNAEYRVVYSGVEDLSGNKLDADTVIHFSTAKQTVFPSAVAHTDYFFNTTLNANGNQPAWLNASPDGFEASANDAAVVAGKYSFMVTDAQNIATSAVLTVVNPDFMFDQNGQPNITALLTQIVTQANADPLGTGLSSIFDQIVWLLSAANTLNANGWKP